MCIAHRLLLSTSEIFDVTASLPSLGYFALQHRVAPPRKAYSLTSSAFIAFGALYPFSLFKPVFRGSLIKSALSVSCSLANVMRVLSTLPSEVWINASCFFIETYNILLSGMS